MSTDLLRKSAVLGQPGAVRAGGRATARRARRARAELAMAELAAWCLLALVVLAALPHLIRSAVLELAALVPGARGGRS